MAIKSKPKQVTTIRLAPDLRTKLKIEAVKENRSFNNHLEGILRKHAFKTKGETNGVLD